MITVGERSRRCGSVSGEQEGGKGASLDLLQLTNARPKDGYGQFLCVLLHHILGQHFGVGIGVRITLDYRRRQRVQRVLVQALGQLERIVASHHAAVELLLDVSQVGVCECSGYMHQCLKEIREVKQVNKGMKL